MNASYYAFVTTVTSLRKLRKGTHRNIHTWPQNITAHLWWQRCSVHTAIRLSFET